eukprot:COSAG01_NODE_2413_length_7745_cov_2.532304_7_plen_355_part_00
MFDHIVWVTLGQTPDTASVQSLAYSQLTGSKFSTDEREEQRSVSLQQAMQDKKLLLVLDDIWDASHEKLVNFIDEDCGAKVLLSSRVRGVLAGSKSKSTKNLEDDARMTESIIDIGLPSEDDAIKMLLATADLSIDGELPLEARELVRFCKMLPLTISIAGKLVKEVDIQEAADWEGVVEMMKDEFAENDEQRTVEETVISVSMKSIRGGHAKNVMHLFKSLALLPEDAVVPVEIVSIMFHSVHGDDGSSMKCPSVPLTRRWLKQLIDRSLVLGESACLSPDFCTDLVHELEPLACLSPELCRDCRSTGAARHCWGVCGRTAFERRAATGPPPNGGSAVCGSACRCRHRFIRVV